MPLSGGTSGVLFQRVSGSGDYSPSVTLDTTATVLRKEDYKFSARYSSLVRPSLTSNGFVEKAEETLRQLGLVDDPSILWELTPWSWLVDWCTNIGTSLVNAHKLSPLSGRHSVDYAYFTTQTTEVLDKQLVRLNKTDWTQYGFTNDSVAIQPKGYFATTSRTRSRATPFGFGTQLGDISSTQFAILVALGLARVR
jgi:hypothetical protein